MELSFKVSNDNSLQIQNISKCSKMTHYDNIEVRAYVTDKLPYDTMQVKKKGIFILT
jgi:hypothetical protein